MTADEVYQLAENERASIAESVLGLLRRCDSDPSDARFFDALSRSASVLPVHLRRVIAEFDRNDDSATLLIQGLPTGARDVGPTPHSWLEAASLASGRFEEFVLGLVATEIGEPFSWPTLQAGRLIQNVLPTPGKEHSQSGHSSLANLNFHTEDGFHPYRPDHLLLTGMRNDDSVPTVVCSVRDVALDSQVAGTLADKRYFIVPDDEHLQQLALHKPSDRAVRCVERMKRRPEPVAVLYGDPKKPRLCIDPTFMTCHSGDVEAENALAAITEQLSAAQREIVVRPGSILIIDNSIAAHGRKPFVARYDGTDRWLKKIITTRELAKSRAARESDNSRVVFDCD